MDIEKINESLNSVKDDVSYVENIINDIVKEYSSDLDNIMENIYNNVINDEYPAINTIEKYFMELSNCLYFMCEKSERLGVFDSNSKSKAQETYNIIHPSPHQ